MRQLHSCTCAMMQIAANVHSPNVVDVNSILSAKEFLPFLIENTIRYLRIINSTSANVQVNIDNYNVLGMRY